MRCAMLRIIIDGLLAVLALLVAAQYLPIRHYYR